MTNVIGAVEQVDIKKVTTSYGESDKLGVKLGGKWYSTFLNKKNDYFRNVSDNDNVSIEFATKGEYNNIVDLRVLPKDAVKTSEQVTSDTARPTRTVNRDTNINYQSARKDSIPFVQLLIANGALPKFSDKTKQADKADILEEAVHTYALRFAQRALSVDAVDFENSIAVGTAAPKAEVKTYNE